MSDRRSASGVRYEARDGRVLVPLKVVPGASRSKVVGPLGDRLKVAVAAPPERGAANAEVCRVLAAALGVRPGDVAVVAGHGTPLKVVAVPGSDVAAVRAALEGA
ncbi:MAG: DUF167 domain-containing protein [Planctomycetota bacterium]